MDICKSPRPSGYSEIVAFIFLLVLPEISASFPAFCTPLCTIHITSYCKSQILVGKAHWWRAVLVVLAELVLQDQLQGPPVVISFMYLTSTVPAPAGALLFWFHVRRQFLPPAALT